MLCKRPCQVNEKTNYRLGENIYKPRSNKGIASEIYKELSLAIREMQIETTMKYYYTSE